MGKILRVGNFGFENDAVTLKETFSEIGGVTQIRLAESQFFGFARGFGFVEMASDENAAKRIEYLYAKDHAGRFRTVAEAPNETHTKKRRSK